MNCAFLFYGVLALVVGVYGRKIVDLFWNWLNAKLDEEQNERIKQMMSEGNL